MEAEGKRRGDEGKGVKHCCRAFILGGLKMYARGREGRAVSFFLFPASSLTSPLTGRR